MFILHTLSISHSEYVALLNEFMREYSSVYGGHRNVYTHTHTHTHTNVRLSCYLLRTRMTVQEEKSMNQCDLTGAKQNTRS